LRPLSARAASVRDQVRQSDVSCSVDDYAHHPTEIRRDTRDGKSAGRNRVLAMFQPPRYSRTQALRKEFGSAFDDADRVYVTDFTLRVKRRSPGSAARRSSMRLPRADMTAPPIIRGSIDCIVSSATQSRRVIWC
jgi:UDP-N-acetylmuramate-alanine ligase